MFSAAPLPPPNPHRLHEGSEEAPSAPSSCYGCANVTACISRSAALNHLSACGGEAANSSRRGGSRHRIQRGSREMNAETYCDGRSRTRDEPFRQPGLVVGWTNGYPRASEADQRKDLVGPSWHPVSWLRRADRSSISSFHLAVFCGIVEPNWRSGTFASGGLARITLLEA
jgi:hypothetical protein